MEAGLLYNILVCVAGALVQEVFHWLQLRARLTPAELKEVKTSIWTLALTVFVVFVAVPIMAVVWFGAGEQQSPKEYFLFGAGVPLLLKSGIGASLSSDSRVKLGSGRNTFRRYLGLP